MIKKTISIHKREVFWLKRQTNNYEAGINVNLWEKDTQSRLYVQLSGVNQKGYFDLTKYDDNDMVSAELPKELAEKLSEWLEDVAIDEGGFTKYERENRDKSKSVLHSNSSHVSKLEENLKAIMPYDDAIRLTTQIAMYGAVTRENFTSDERFEMVDALQKEFFSAIASTKNAMTPAEIEKEFNLSSGTVRQYLFQNQDIDQSLARKADGRTWLINREWAVKRWGNGA